MNVQVVGCSHQNTPLSLRERLAFSAEQNRAALDGLRSAYPDVESVLVSTCNRTEIYIASNSGELPTREQIAVFLGGFHNMDPAEIVDHLYGLAGRDAVRHLFLVASSLDSMVVGEAQISSQVKQAYQLATDENATGPLTHAAFQAASRIARRVASETAIHEHRVSIPSVAVTEFAQQIFERLDDKKTLVIGAGEMAEETLRYVRDRGARDVTIVNRSPRRAAELARQWQGRESRWERLPEELAAADLVISTTSAEQPVVTQQMFESAALASRERPLLVLDLAVPRDFEPEIGERLGVFLYTLDDLQIVCERNRKRREKELPAAMRIVEKETDRFMMDMNSRAIGPVVGQLKRHCDGPKERELERLFNKLPHLDQRARHEIRRSFDRLTNKIFHPTLDSLRMESRTEVPTTLLDAMKRLFQFKD